ncbi:MAG: carboxylesterase family protein [Myxococcota bacterium]
MRNRGARPGGGTTLEDGVVHAWRGIPYAKPPVRPLRWRAPQPAEPWENVREAPSGLALREPTASRSPGRLSLSRRLRAGHGGEDAATSARNGCP